MARWKVGCTTFHRAVFAFFVCLVRRLAHGPPLPYFKGILSPPFSVEPPTQGRRPGGETKQRAKARRRTRRPQRWSEGASPPCVDLTLPRGTVAVCSCWSHVCG